MPSDSAFLSIAGDGFLLHKNSLRSLKASAHYGMRCVQMPLEWGPVFCLKPHASPWTGIRCEVTDIVRASPLPPPPPPPSPLPSSSSSSSSSSAAEVASTVRSSFPRPSAKWGVVQGYQNQTPSQEQVMSFLKGEGIETREFDAVELPPSVEIVKERMDFLCKLGLEKQHINSYPLMLCCSIKKNMVPVIDYLEKLGFTPSTLQSFLRKYPMVLHTSVVVDLQPLIYYLEGLGIDRNDLSAVLLKYPEVLGFRLEGTMSTSVAYLVSIGVSIREVGPMLTEYPQILGMRVGNNIKLKVDYICSLGLSKEAVAKMLVKHPYLLGLGLDGKFRPAIAALMRAGVREQALSAILLRFPDVLAIDLDEKLPRKHNWLIKQIHVRPEDVPPIIEQFPQIIVVNEGMAMERVNFLIESGGFEEAEIAKMVPRCPHILALSIENALRPNLEYFKNKMKRPLQELVDFPTYLTYNLDDRIRPRYQQISRKGIKCSLSWFLNCKDSKFHERLEMDYVESELAERASLPYESSGGEHHQLQDYGAEPPPFVDFLNKSMPHDEGEDGNMDVSKEFLHTEEDDDSSEWVSTEQSDYQVQIEMSQIPL